MIQVASTTGGIGSQRDDFNDVSSPLRAGYEGQEFLFASNHLFYCFIASLLSTRSVSRGEFHIMLHLSRGFHGNRKEIR
jgi:hypothetical protein